MTRTVGYVWRLREVMASHGVWKTTDLGPLLAERGVVLSAAQVYRLAARIPERLSLRTLAALCDIFGCTPNELIDTRPEPAGVSSPVVSSPVVAPDRRGPAAVVGLAKIGRPRRARVDPRS